jgi:zinc protease
MANKAFAKLLYGKSIAGEPAEGTIKTIKSMSVKDVQSYYDRFYSPTVTNVVIVGDVSEGEIMPKLEFLKNWRKKEVALPSIASAASPVEKTQIYLIDKYKAAQSEIRVGYLSMPYDYNGKFFKATVMNYPLGGHFNSRLNLNLREDKGFTYGIRSGLRGTHNPGVYGIAAGVRASATDSAIREIFNEVTNYRRKGITDEELDFTRKSLTQSDALRYEAMYQKAGFLNQIVNYNLPDNYIEEQNKILRSLSKDEINALANELLPADKMVVVIVGDKEVIGKPLEKLGYKVIDYKLD